MKTHHRMRTRIEEDLMAGRMPCEQECMALVHDAGEAERLEMQFEAFRIALEDVGFAIIDVTTDDDEATVLEIVAAEMP